MCENKTKEKDMTDIKPVNLNTQNIISKEFENSKPQKEAVEQEKEVKPQVQQKAVSADAVLDFMANSAVVSNVKLSPAALVNKYNSPEAIARIGAMMADFEEGVVAGLEKFEEEMGAVPAFKNLSEADKMALGAEFFTSNAVE